MSSFNNMDNVPVKIAEKYKPPPRVYQVPQSILNKLQLPPNYYHEAPQYTYDFKLEKKVLSKIPEWRQMRELERDRRRERKDKREQQKLREVEEQHKKMLGAVSYPSADDLSIESDEENIDVKYSPIPQKDETIEENVNSTQNKYFDTILQPTILPRKEGTTIKSDKIAETSAINSGNVLSASKFTNAFNYKDFEDDTSSPFDNIELKSINDLDILAQVLHNSQLATLDNSKATEEDQSKVETEIMSSHNIKNGKNSNSESINDLVDNISNLKFFENTNAALEKVDFNDSSHQLKNESIPTTTTALGFSNINQNMAIQGPTYTHYPYINQPQSRETSYMPYNNHLYNDFDHHSKQQQYNHFNVTSVVTPNQNQNYLYSTSSCNGLQSAYYSPMHGGACATEKFMGNNANDYLTSYGISNTMLNSEQNLVTEKELQSKSKSVPDILKELSDEVRNSEIRRYRNLSSNFGDNSEQEDLVKGSKTQSSQQTPIKTVLSKNELHQYYSKLEGPAQKLVKTISRMGFPLERVAKIAQIFGADDKKIIEHLIPLSELIDLGFEETKISEALMKFGNNKEKAIEYLIS